MTEDTPVRQSRKFTAAERTELVQLITTIIECYAMAEAIWYMTHDQWLYEVVLEKMGPVRDAIRYRMEVLHTLRSIRRLPE